MNQKGNTIGWVIGILALIVVIALAIVYYRKSYQTTYQSPSPVSGGATVSSPGTSPTTSPATSPAASQNQVSYTDSGFSPASLTIKVGDKVTWVNNSSSAIDIASNPHPVHTDLPALRSNSLASGKNYSFTFTKAGTFGYHNHLATSQTGTVIVK